MKEQRGIREIRESVCWEMGMISMEGSGTLSRSKSDKGVFNIMEPPLHQSRHGLHQMKSKVTGHISWKVC